MKNKSIYTPTLHACYLGYITQAIVVNLVPLFFVIFQNKYGLSYTDIANLVLTNFVVQIIVDALMIKFVVLLGYRRSSVLAHICVTVGLVSLTVLPTFLPPYIGFLISTCIYAIGGGLIEVVVSPVVDALPGEAKASAMSLLHAFYSWGQVLVVLLTTAALALIGDDNWWYIPCLWALIPFFNIFNFLRVPMVEVTAEQKSAGIGKFLRSPIFIVALVMMLCGGAAELVMSQWASLFAERALGVPKMMGDLLGPCFFALCMGIGRTAYGIIGEKRINIEMALAVTAGFTIVCYLVTVFVPMPVVALLGCAFTGFGVSLMWPGVLSYTSQKYNYKAGPVLFTLLALGGDIGCSSGPWLTGAVSDLYIRINGMTAGAESQAIRYGILAALVFPVVMLIMIGIMRKLRHKDYETAENSAA